MKKNVFVCLNCKQKIDKYSTICKCGAKFKIISMPYNNLELLNKYKLYTARDILNFKSEENFIEGFEFLGELPKKYLKMVWGEAGSGKSFYSMLYATKIAKLNPSKYIIYWSCEEGISATIKNKINLCKCAKRNNLLFSNASSFKKLKKEIRIINPILLIIDSLNHAKIGIEKLKELNKESFSTLFVNHAIKSSNYRGVTTVGHLVDIIIKVDNGVATTTKNRLSKTEQTFGIFEYMGLKDNNQEKKEF